MAQEYKERAATTRETEVEQPEEIKDLTNATLTAEIDDLLDEIDEVLEENAEEFVRNYIQKGGE